MINLAAVLALGACAAQTDDAPANGVDGAPADYGAGDITDPSSTDDGNSPSPVAPEGGEEVSLPPPPRAPEEPEPSPASEWAQACDADAASLSPDSHPFAPLPDVGAGLVNVSEDLEELLEHGALPTACSDWRDDPTSEQKKLLCGKQMFFYETFDTGGMPGGLVRFLVERFPEVGPGFEAFGMIPDPYSAEAMPLGLAPTSRPQPDSYSFTCASCHFGQMPDGRYAVGYPNHEYDYGGHVLSLFLFPQLAQPFADPSAHDPIAVARVQPMLDRYAGDVGMQLSFGLIALGLLGQAIPEIGPDIERAYAMWRSGTMDFMMAPTPIDDGVHTVHRIQPLWGIPTDELVQSTGADGALLGWSGGTYDVRDFLRAFVDLGFGDTDAWDDAALEPLAAYVESLRAPANPSPPPTDEVHAGCLLFESEGCLACHDGVGGAGKRVYAIDEVDTDPAIARWMDPELDGEVCCGIEAPDFDLTHGVKSPRLRGLWAFSRFLHNGSLDSLEQLVCLEPRPPDGPEPFGTHGHELGCELPDADKRSLLSFLLSH
jgi:hypothetical protein